MTRTLRLLCDRHPHHPSPGRSSLQTEFCHRPPPPPYLRLCGSDGSGAPDEWTLPGAAFGDGPVSLRTRSSGPAHAGAGVRRASPPAWTTSAYPSPTRGHAGCFPPRAALGNTAVNTSVRDSGFSYHGVFLPSTSAVAPEDPQVAPGRRTPLPRLRGGGPVLRLFSFATLLRVAAPPPNPSCREQALLPRVCPSECATPDPLGR